jgi:transcriptional regulator with XRE-family HTH domain
MEMTDVRVLLAKNMKRCRSILGLSQMALAERIGCSTTLIGNIETLHRFPSADSLNRIAAALRIHPSELFAEDSAAINRIEYAIEVRDRLESRIHEAIDEALARYDKHGRDSSGSDGK